MKRFIFLATYLMSITFLQSMPLFAGCPCKHPPKQNEPQPPVGTFSYEYYMSCGCGGGGIGGNNDELPPDED